MIRKLAATLAVAALSVTLGATPADAHTKPNCKTVSITDRTTEQWDGTEGLPEGYQTAYRDGYTLTERCRGRLVTRHVYTEWVLA